jgi:hypothetical protein
MVRENRARNLEKYRDYDRNRASNPNRVLARNIYSKSESGKASHAKSVRINRKNNPERSYARGVLARAVAEWGMPKPTSCQSCGTDCTPHGHHEDYRKPLDVIWLCVPCHTERHRQLKEAA